MITIFSGSSSAHSHIVCDKSKPHVSKENWTVFQGLAQINPH